jgi:catechol 2,3-dioxygenase-like lactoylglutathione lyase family enzyme
MLGSKDVMATVAVRSLATARPFYEETLGLKAVDESQAEHGVVSLRAGATTVLVYQSQFAGTNRATVLTWALGEAFDAAVKALQAKGVVFETYDFPGATLDGPVHVMGDMRVVWFKDPDGNILSIASG